MSDILVTTPNGQMPCWLAVPPLLDSEPRSGHGPHPDRFPGVVVLHDVGGMTRDHRRQADWLAEAGFLSLAVNLYYRGGFPLCLRSIMRDCAARSGPLFDDIEATRSWLLAQPNCSGKIGVIGFCMGGGFALMLVSGHGFSAASINYGGKLPPDVDDFLKAPCPVIGSYGGLARFEKGAADQLQRALERALVPHDVKEYPGAGHSFMNHHRGYFIFNVLRYRDIGYNEEATLDARRRIAAFFHTHLD